MELTPVQLKFVLHWGEMGATWGINRTVAQIHALLYLTPVPMDAEEISQTLGVARSNVSTSLKELLGWGIVKRVHVFHDRRDRFETLQDPWELFRIIVDERKKREIDPTLEMLRECHKESLANGDKETSVRLGRMVEFFETMTGWYDQMRKLPLAMTIKFVKMGSKVPKWLGLAS
jgi:DNA-binding transcriptional regulator GbsR (MarR family)